MKVKIVSVTRKGQATLPVDMRRRHNLQKRVLVVDTKEGLLIKPLPTPESERGSLKHIFKKTARELLKESRVEDSKREKRLEELV